MSWGYWGIVTGLLLVLGVFFVCIEIMYRTPLTPSTKKPQPTSEGSTREKHVAA